SEGDARRDAHFRASGFRVLRFWNDDVIRNIDGVCAEILMAAGRGRWGCDRLAADLLDADPPSGTIYHLAWPGCGCGFLPRKGGRSGCIAPPSRQIANVDDRQRCPTPAQGEGAKRDERPAPASLPRGSARLPGSSPFPASVQTAGALRAEGG